MKFITRLLRGRKTEARSIPSSASLPVTDLPNELSLRQTQAGVTVNDITALSVPAVFAAIRAISEDVAKLPFNVMKQLPIGGSERAIRHAVQAVINSPNSEMTRFDLVQAWVGCALMWGTGYTQIVRRGNGEPYELWPIESYRVLPWRDQNKYLWYHVYPGGTWPLAGRMNEVATIPHEDMLVLKNYNFNGLLGLIISRIGGESLGLAIALQQYAASLFGNGSRPSGVITTQDVLDEPAAKRLKANWEAAHGSGQQLGTAVLEKGMNWTQISTPANEAQMIESRSFQIEEICRLFRIPPQKLQHLVKTAFNSAEQFDIEYLKECLLPWFSRAEEEMTKKLLTEPDLYVDIDESQMLRGDTLSLYDAAGKLHLSGLATKNEMRNKVGLNPVEGGDVFLIPKNSMPIGKDQDIEEQQSIMKDAKATAPAPKDAADPADPVDPVEQESPAEDTQETNPTSIDEDPAEPVDGEMRKQIIEAYKPILSDAVTRFLNVEKDKVIRASKKDGFVKWKDEFYTSHRSHVTNTLSPIFMALAVSLRRSDAPRYYGSTIDSLVEKHITDSVSDIADLDGIEQRVNSWDMRVESFVDECIQSIQ